jgi:2-methylisocitrate lyase-like PEP mutase family enzyme
VAIYPISLLLAAARTATEVAAAFARDGTSATSGQEMLSFDEFNRLIGVQAYLDLGKP